MKSGLVALVWLACAGPVAESATDDWPWYGGPNHNGVVKDAPVTPAAEALEVVWKVPMLGRGFSGPAVADGQVFILDRCDRADTGEDVLRVLDLASGRKLWSYSHPAPGDTDEDETGMADRKWGRGRGGIWRMSGICDGRECEAERQEVVFAAFRGRSSDDGRRARDDGPGCPGGALARLGRLAKGRRAVHNQGALNPTARNATAMLAKLKTFSLSGIDALPVKVEVDVSPAGLPAQRLPREQRAQSQRPGPDEVSYWRSRCASGAATTAYGRGTKSRIPEVEYLG
jgi:hypothetical protein